MFTLAIISMVGAFASAAYSAYNEYQVGKQTEKNANAEAEIREEAAREERAMRAIEEGEERAQANRTQGSMEARYAKSGLAIEGTPLHTMALQAEADEYNIRARNRLSDIKADDLSYQGTLLRHRGKEARIAGRTAAIGSILTGAAQVAKQGATWGVAMGGKTTPGNTTPYSAPDMATHVDYGSGPGSYAMNLINNADTGVKNSFQFDGMKESVFNPASSFSLNGAL